MLGTSGPAAPSDNDEPAAKTVGSRPLTLAVLALIVGVLGAVAYLSYVQPLRADDFSSLNVMRSHPGLWSYVEFWYTTWTGRATGMVALWFGLSTRIGFTVANTLAFGLLAWLTLAIALARLPRADSRDISLLGLLLAAYWFTFPSISETVFWTTGATAYLWAAVLMFTSIAPYRIWHAKPHDALPTAQAWPTALGTAVGLLVLGLAAGASQEQVAVTLVLGAGFLLANLVRHKALRSLPWPLWAGLIGLAAGIAVQLLSPGNAVRSALTPADTLSLAGRLESFLQYLLAVFDTYAYAVYPWGIAFAAIAYLFRPLATNRRPGQRSLWWLWAGLAAATIGLFVAQPVIANLAGARTTVFAVSLLLLAGLSPLAGARDDWGDERLRTLFSGLAVVLLVLTLGSAVHSASHATRLSAELREREASIERQLADGTSDVVVAPVTTQATRVLQFTDITGDPAYWTNQAAAQYYGAASMRVAESAEPE